MTDRRCAEQQLAKFHQRQEHGEADLLDRFSESRAKRLWVTLPAIQPDQAKPSETGHINDYVADLRAKGRAKKYIENVTTRLNKLCEDCQWSHWPDITEDSFASWRETPISNRAALAKDHRIGPVTANQYLEAVRAFCSWMVRRGRMPANPLLLIGKMDESSPRRQRRALAEQQLAAVLPAAGDDELVYLTILSTGLRRSEAKALVWADLHLSAMPSPYIQLRAHTTKSKRPDVLPLRADLAQRLQDARGDARDSDRVFSRIPSMERHRAILEAAGVPYRDADGRVADFHALRHTYGTLLSKAGVAPRVAMELMRHTDLRLTMKVYTDPRVFDLAGAVEKLPALATPRPAEKKAVP